MQTDDGRPRLVADSYRTLREIAQGAIFRDIVEGVLPPGQKLVEGELVEKYGIGRGPIREALRALEGQGLVNATSNKGVVVARLTRHELQEIYHIRFELEGLGARLAAPQLSDKQLRGLEELHEAMSQSLDEPRSWLELNNTFHLTLYAASGHKRLYGLIRDLMTSVEPYIRSFLDVPGKLLDTHSEHERILEAARSRDGKRCEQETQAHLARAAEIILTLVPEEEEPIARQLGQTS